MDRETAIAFLKSHQPMPSDEDEVLVLIEEYDKVRKYFVEHPDPKVIPLFLNSFSDGDGFGVYPLVEDVFSSFEERQVVPHIIDALGSEHDGVRYWAADLARNFATPELLEPLARVLANDSSNGTRATAAGALLWIPDDSALRLVQRAYEDATDADLREMLANLLQFHLERMRGMTIRVP